MSKGHAGFAKHLLTLAVFSAVAFGFVAYILFQAGTLPTFGHKYTVEATVPTASLLTPGARVTIAGAEVGSVKAVERADELGPNAKLTIELTDDRVTPLPRDSRVQIRTRSQVGENYVSIVVGEDRKQTIADGGSLGLDQAEAPVDVDEILSTLQGPTRERTRTMLSEFGTALTGRGDELNLTLRGANGTVDHGARLVETLYDDRATVARLVDQLGRVTAAVGDRGVAIDTIARQGVTSLRALGDRDAALAATLRELPATLSEVRRSTRVAGDVSDDAAPVVTNLSRATRDLRPAVAALAPTARAGRGLVADLDRANPSLEHLVSSVARVGVAVPGEIPKLRSVLCQLNPTLRYALPYKKDFLQILFHLGSGANSYDALGHMVRLTPIVNENSASGMPPEVSNAFKVLTQSGTFLPSKVITYDPYMEPGEIGKTVAKKGDPTGPESLRQSGYKYPRVQPDC